MERGFTTIRDKKINTAAAGSEDFRINDFGDFELALTHLHKLLGPRRAVTGKARRYFSLEGVPIDEGAEQENSQERVLHSGMILSRLYGRLGGLFHPGSLSRLWRIDKSEVGDRIYREISELWNRRGSPEPVSIIFSRDEEYTRVGDEISVLWEKIEEKRIELRELDGKGLGMRGKALRHFERERIDPVMADLKQLVEQHSRLTDLEKNITEEFKKELALKRMLNRRLSLFTCEEYWNAQIYAISTLFPLGLAKDEREKMIELAESALLKWALEHESDPSFKGGVSMKTKGGPHSLTRGVIKRLSEFERLYAIARKKISGKKELSPADLNHVSIIYNQLIRMLN